MLGTHVDIKSGNRAIVQVFEGTSGVDVKKVSMRRISIGVRSTV
jgi:vacuolar-type H+-ATPase subunit B/Vma2